MSNRQGSRDRRVRAALAVGLFFVLPLLAAEASQSLSIPPRQQWDENNGYCGECCIQQSALFFGTYVSQYACRRIYDPTQQRDVLVDDGSAETVLAALRLTYQEFDSAAVAAPQYQPYMLWIKKHLQARHPVMFISYCQDGDDPYYDHIMLATGLTATQLATYSASDRLYFNDNYETYKLSRTFGSLYDTRRMAGNGARYYYCIPRNYDYGLAITGIRDDSRVARPVMLTIDRSDEPNPFWGESPVQLHAVIQTSGLVAGRYYTLYRYDDYRRVPTRNYAASVRTYAKTFLAPAATQRFLDTFRSDRIVIYRCVPTGY